MSLLLINSNALHIPLADKSVQCVITSPPYYGLRDYGTATWLGGDPACDHIDLEKYAERQRQKKSMVAFGELLDGSTRTRVHDESIGKDWQYRNICHKCGAQRVDNQLGLEKQPDCLGWATGNPCGECYVCHVVQWAREVWRVLRDDGVFWLNLGDSYTSTAQGTVNSSDDYGGRNRNPNMVANYRPFTGLKPKDLIGIPWRVAFALQADGWWLRSDIIWHKPNPMPESVKDRCTKSHEYIFMLTKSARYYFDNVAILEPAEWTSKNSNPNKRGFSTKSDIDNPQHHGGNMNGNFIKTGRTGDGHKGAFDKDGRIRATYGLSGNGFKGHSGNNDANGNSLLYEKNGLPARNKRDVWSIATSPFKGAHYAVFPPKLVEPMILSSTSEKGCCPECGKPWERIVEKEKHPADENKITEMEAKGVPRYTGNLWGDDKRHTVILNESWQPTCSCNAGDPVPCIVLDPFAGSGTTLLVARNLGRSAIGCDLSYSYLHEQAHKRLELDKLKFA